MAKSIFRSVDSLETEGDAREAYAAWMADMADTTIVEDSGKAVVIDLETEDLPFQVENKMTLVEIIAATTFINVCFWGLVWSMDRVEKMETKEKSLVSPPPTYVKETIVLDDIEEEVIVEAKTAYEDEDIIIEEMHDD